MNDLSAPSPVSAAGALKSLPPPSPFKAPARSTPVGSTFVDWASLPERTTATGIYRAVFDAPTPTFERLEVHVSTLNPGASPHAPHRHAWEEMLILKEGTVDVSINGAITEARPGAVIFFASHDVHTVANRGPAPATYYVLSYFSEAARTVRDEPAAYYAAADRLKSSVVNWDDVPSKDGTHDARRIFLNSATLTFLNLRIHATTLPGGRYPVRHGAHLNPLLVIVKEGAVESNVDGVSHLVPTGGIIFLAPGAIQTIRNPTDKPATYYVVSVTSHETPRTL